GHRGVCSRGHSVRPAGARQGGCCSGCGQGRGPRYTPSGDGDNIIPRAQIVGAGSARGASEKPYRLWLPSQNGLVADPPQRHRTTTSAGRPSFRAGTASSRPSGVTILTGPSTIRGPLGLVVIRVASMVQQ